MIEIWDKSIVTYQNLCYFATFCWKHKKHQLPGSHPTCNHVNFRGKKVNIDTERIIIH